MKISTLFLTTLIALSLSGCGQKEENQSAEHGHESAEHGHEAEAAPRGPHGGRLFEQDGFGLEVTIFETGTEPQLRLYVTQNDKPVDPATAQVTVVLERLGATQTIKFSPKDDYLLGDAVIHEPHSFAVKITAVHAQKSYQFVYEQLEGRVQLSAEQQKAAGLEILKAGPAAISAAVELQGEIRVAPNSETVVLAPFAGVVTSAPASLGQAVTAGTVLATLESRELADLKRTYLEARERAKLADSNFQREAMLWKEKITTEQDYLGAKSQKAEADINVASQRAALLSFGLNEADLKALSLEQPGNLARFVLRAPRSGRITARELSPGQRITQDTALFTIADLDNLTAQLAATPAQLQGLKPGQEVEITLVSGSADHKTTGRGKVQVVSPQLNESNRSATVYVALENSTPWQTGQFVKARVLREKTTAAVTVSNEALQSFRDGTVVYARFGDQFEIRPVTLGRQDGKHSEILEGLAAGQEYVGKNSFLLKADLGKAEAEHDH